MSRPTTSIIVPAYNAGWTLFETVRALLDRPFWDELIVVDDGSRDVTAALSFPPPVRLVRHRTNRGKGRAIMSGIRAASGEVLLFLDSDLGATAAHGRRLVEAIWAGRAHHVVGLVPRAHGDGFGWVSRFAQEEIFRRSGVRLKQPLSGQRALSGALARRWADRLDLRYGVEVMLTLSSLAEGLVPLEIALPFDHRRLGKTPAGFLHRMRQGWDIVRALRAYDAMKQAAEVG